MPRRTLEPAAWLAGLLALIAAPAAADVTIIGHYRLANGDTLTRASYYSSKRVRTTLPNGYEIIYQQPSDRIALVDHAGKRYWEGPRAAADSIIAPMRKARARKLQESMTPETQEQWNQIYSALTGGVHVARTDSARTICEYPCSQWVLTAGPYLRQVRWVARSLDMPDFGPEVRNVVLASFSDLLGAGLMKLVLQARDTDGLTLAGRIQFKTLDQQGETSWEALKVVSGKIPDTAWRPPQEYQRWKPPAGGAGAATGPAKAAPLRPDTSASDTIAAPRDTIPAPADTVTK